MTQPPEVRTLQGFGLGLPNRAPELAALGSLTAVARKADELGFADVWVSANTLDHAYSVDPWIALASAAAVTTSVGLGLGVAVLPLDHPLRFAHAAASLDQLSGGRLRLAVGLGKADEFPAFGVPVAGRVSRLLEGVAAARACWADPRPSFSGAHISFPEVSMQISPKQEPLPLWLGGAHEDALKRAVAHGTGWLGAGAQGAASFDRCTRVLLSLLEECEDASHFAVAKRVFVAIDDDQRRARDAVNRWFQDVYGKPDAGDAGLYGSVEQVASELQDLLDSGANYLILNPVHDSLNQADAAAAVAGVLSLARRPKE